MKGIITLTIYLFGEAVGVANAIADERFYAGFEKRASDAMECPAGGPPGSCQAKYPAPSFAKRLLTPFKRASSKAMETSECCHECVKCLDSDPKCWAKISRGGSLDPSLGSSAAEGLAAAAAVATPYGIPLGIWKVLFQALLTTINVVCWLVPLRSKKISDNELALSLANAFSGGVFLSLAFGHLIPECTHGFGPNWPEAAPYLFILGGYMVIFFVEKVAFDAHDIMQEMQQGNQVSVQAPNASDHDTDVAKTSGEINGVAEASSPGGSSAVILLGALAVHSVLEMMALGLSKTFSEGALLTLSIALHQPAESIALLVAFLKSGMPKRQIIQYLSVFSCMGPIGVALGMAVNEYAAPIVDSIMLAIVAGTFVYVGATEIIPEEWEDSTHKWKKFGALMSGIATILVITTLTADM